MIEGNQERILSTKYYCSNIENVETTGAVYDWCKNTGIAAADAAADAAAAAAAAEAADAEAAAAAAADAEASLIEGIDDTTLFSFVAIGVLLLINQSYV